MSEREYEEWERLNQRIELIIIGLLIVLSLVLFGVVLPMLTTSII
jgi:uncharacterized membrane protein YbaN (DUF454 family)